MSSVYLRSRTGKLILLDGRDTLAGFNSVQGSTPPAAYPSLAMCDAKTRKPAPAILEKVAIYENGTPYSKTTIFISRFLNRQTIYDRKYRNLDCP